MTHEQGYESLSLYLFSPLPLNVVTTLVHGKVRWIRCLLLALIFCLCLCLRLRLCLCLCLMRSLQNGQRATQCLDMLVIFFRLLMS